jgi:hypothetical protein
VGRVLVGSGPLFDPALQTPKLIAAWTKLEPSRRYLYLQDNQLTLPEERRHVRSCASSQHAFTAAADSCTN